MFRKMANGFGCTFWPIRLGAHASFLGAMAYVNRQWHSTVKRVADDEPRSLLHTLLTPI
jgi:hypothetical protein